MPITPGPASASPALQDPALDHIVAPARWRAVDFISDLHLHPDEAQTFDAWRHYLRHGAAQAVFILGDLFEVWVGDDAAAGDIAAPPAPHDSFELRCARVLLDASARVDMFFLCGNRDFLVGTPFLATCGVRAVQDPCRLDFADQRWLLSHGDALCLADTDYQRFRATVRSAQWQDNFLAQSLQQRQAIARELRDKSEQHKRAHPVPAQVDEPTAASWLRDASAQALIHGHTHQPADHALGGGLRRTVLSDWDLRATPPRAQVLRLARDIEGKVCMRRLSVDAAC